MGHWLGGGGGRKQSGRRETRERQEGDGGREETATGGSDLTLSISLVYNPIICLTFGVSL